MSTQLISLTQRVKQAQAIHLDRIPFPPTADKTTQNDSARSYNQASKTVFQNSRQRREKLAHWPEFSNKE